MALPLPPPPPAMARMQSLVEVNDGVQRGVAVEHVAPTHSSLAPPPPPPWPLAVGGLPDSAPLYPPLPVQAGDAPGVGPLPPRAPKPLQPMTTVICSPATRSTV